jgi:hypothetical protein
MDNLKQPASEIAGSMALSVRENSINPTINAIDSKVSGWIQAVIAGLVILLIIAGFVLYKVVSQLRAATDNLRMIAGEYTIVRKDSLVNSKKPIKEIP